MRQAAAGGRTGGTPKGERRRAEIIAAATDLVREQGPQALAHRAVAARAGVPLAATTYYFHDLDDLAAAAGEGLVAGWVAHAVAVLDRVGAGSPADVADDTAVTGGGPPTDDLALAAAVLTEALLPPGDDAQVRAHHEQLLAVARLPALAAAVGRARGGLDAVIVQLLDTLLPDRWHPSPALVLAVCDGAVVAAASESRPVRSPTVALLIDLLAGPSRAVEPGPVRPAGR